MLKGQRRAAPSSFPWLSHCTVKVEGKRVWKRKERKRKKLKKPLLITRRRDRICCDSNSRGNCCNSNITVLKRQSCSPWKGRNWKSLIIFFPSPLLLHQLPQLKSLVKSAAENSTLLQMRGLWLKSIENPGEIFLQSTIHNSMILWFTAFTAVRNAFRQLLAAACPQPNCKGFLSLFLFVIWVDNFNAIPALHTNCCNASFATMCCVWQGAGQMIIPSLHSRSGLLTQFLWKLPPLADV